MILTAASKLYGAAARWRRSWYTSNRRRQRRLSAPVVSVGNLSVGGTGKTPTVAYLARLLTAKGYKPGILTRGYGRRSPASELTVVSIDSPVEATGDEPLMLARALDGVPVIVCADRYRGGRFAESLGTNVHILDDGFQHLQLARDVDLLLIGEDDLTDRVLPAGRLREPLIAADAADAVILSAGATAADASIRRSTGEARSFELRRTIAAPNRASMVFAVAGIARPERFFSDLREAGWAVAGTRAFRDHHPYTQDDIERIAGEARAARAGEIVTTEKDDVRLGKHQLGGLPVTVVPLTVSIEPAGEFASWLVGRLAASGRAAAMDRDT